MERLPPSEKLAADLAYAKAGLERARSNERACTEDGQRALGLFEKLYGAHSRKVSNALEVLALCHLEMNQADVAIPYLERGLAVRKQVLGPEHPDVALMVHNLGMVARQFDRYEEAERYYLEALRLRIQATGPQHSDVGISYNNLGNLAFFRKRFDEALVYAQKAMVIFEKTVGPESGLMGNALSIAGHAEKGRRRFAVAEEYYRRALEIRRKHETSDPLAVMMGHQNLGEALVGRGQLQAGLGWLERAVARAEKPDVDPNRRGRALFALAQALANTGRDRGRRALALARRAGAEFSAPQDAAERQETEVFLAKMGTAAALRP